MERVVIVNIKYGYLDKNLLDYYNTLDIRRKKYVDFRGQGYNKAESYKMAGYNAKNYGQAAYNLERNDLNIKQIIEDITNHNKLNQLTDGKGDLQRQINALSDSAQTRKALKVLENATGEEAMRIKFYTDIAGGKTKTIEKTTIKDRDGNIKEERIVEKEPSISDRMVARAKLDAILGITDMASAVGQVQAGQITVTIVDASNKQQKQDKRNEVVIDADFEETTKPQEESDVNV
jgi:hypothetical protein